MPRYSLSNQPSPGTTRPLRSGESSRNDGLNASTKPYSEYSHFP